MESTVAALVLLIATILLTLWMTRMEHKQRNLENQLALVSEVLGRATPELGRKIEESSTRFVFNESSWDDSPNVTYEDYTSGNDRVI